MYSDNAYTESTTKDHYGRTGKCTSLPHPGDVAPHTSRKGSKNRQAGSTDDYLSSKERKKACYNKMDPYFAARQPSQ
jgi:hypothetical protein